MPNTSKVNLPQWANIVEYLSYLQQHFGHDGCCSGNLNLRKCEGTITWLQRLRLMVWFCIVLPANFCKKKSSSTIDIYIYFLSNTVETFTSIIRIFNPTHTLTASISRLPCQTWTLEIPGWGWYQRSIFKPRTYKNNNCDPNSECQTFTRSMLKSAHHNLSLKHWTSGYKCFEIAILKPQFCCSKLKFVVTIRIMNPKLTKKHIYMTIEISNLDMPCPEPYPLSESQTQSSRQPAEWDK